MDQDWLADVRKYDANADENIVAGIVRYCGIALRSENASKVTFEDKEETDRVRDKFLKKKLALTDSDAKLDAAIQTVGSAMGGGERNRVSVYYLLTKHFGLLEMFNKPAKGAKKKASGSGTKKAAAATTATTATTAAAATTSAASSSASASTSTSTASAGTAPVSTAMSSTSAASASTAASASGGASGSGGGAGHSSTTHSDDDDDDKGIWGIAALAGTVMFGAIMFAAIASVWVKNTALTADPVEETAAAAPAEPEPAPEPTQAAEPEAPEGAGVTASERDGKPMLTVYFDSGSSVVSPDFGDTSSELVTFMNDNPDATVDISGYNDPTGNAEINARLSKERAENVQAALVAGGVDQARTELVKPDDSTTTDMTPAQARRVEIVINE